MIDQVGLRLFVAMMAMIMLTAMFANGCTETTRTKVLGGSMFIEVPCDQQVFDVTWKGKSFWYATQPAPEGWKPTVKHFIEHSDFGLVEGEVKLTETRCK
tara:strand:- start:7 stop:306 length:300 start_codon:yes stop_codon:yes gene_type:complete